MVFSLSVRFDSTITDVIDLYFDSSTDSYYKVFDNPLGMPISYTCNVVPVEMMIEFEDKCILHDFDEMGNYEVFVCKDGTKRIERFELDF